jgi:serine O-acetyltransferase
MSRLSEAIHAAADGLEAQGARPTRQLQPDPMELSVLVEHARQLLFPEFIGSSHSPSLPLAIGAWANHLINLVATERHRTCPRTEVDPNECNLCLDSAHAVATEVVKRLPNLREVLATDLQAALEADPAALGAFEVFLCYPGFLAVTSHRLANALLVNGAPLIARLVAEHAHSRTGVDIHPGAKIEPGFFIDHGTGVVVGETAEIGKSVRLYQGVTLGALSLSKERVKRMHGVKRHPTIEADVIVYANATILGGDTVIGQGAVIGGNSWVTRSVAPGAIVTTQDITM